MPCECDNCQRDRKVAKRLARMRQEARVFWLGIYEDLAHAEMDRDVNAAVIDGSWPSADEVIAHRRHRASRGEASTQQSAGGE